MDDEEEAKCIDQQKREIDELRAKLESLCEARGYTLAHVCKGLKPENYSLDGTSQKTWHGLESPKSWFLDAAKLTRESHWGLTPVERKKRRDGCLRLLE